MKKKSLASVATAERHPWVRDEFDRLARSGVLGDPNGRPAMTYLRVSSAGQAEEGRSGFPRQLLNVHDKAYTVGLFIPWELVFFDDHTGFEFRDRPNLTRLRQLIKSPQRTSSDLIIENLDRLSREATWHQGFLLDEIEKEHRVRVHFWKELGSTLERVVYGTIAQDRMLTDLQRMATGNLIKARSGRVTARTPAFGYKLVNAQGGEENCKKDTHYSILESEARVVRLIFELLVKHRYSLLAISRHLTDQGYQPPKKSRAWDPTLLYAIVTNTVYYGQFYAHRTMHVKTISRITGREVIHKVDRPRDEWIAVPVPAIVPADVWHMAQTVLKENNSKSRRNAKAQYLLTGFLYCADCGTHICGKYKGSTRKTRSGPRVYRYAGYLCVTRARPKHLILSHQRACSMPHITAEKLDNLVWSQIRDVLFDSQRLAQGLDRYFARNSGDSTKEEFAYVQTQLTNLDLVDAKHYEAYMSGAFSAEEYAEKRLDVREKRRKLEAQKEEISSRLTRQLNHENVKGSILASADDLRQRAQTDVPFELKRRILMTVVEKITLNTREEWFEIEGAIQGRFDFIPMDTGSLRRPA